MFKGINYTAIIYRAAILLFLLTPIYSVAQDLQVNILGGVEINNGGSATITNGNALTFRITNSRSNCGILKVKDITTSSSDFSISPSSLSVDIRSVKCKNGIKYFDFTVTNISTNCAPTATITIQSNNEPDFTFTVSMNASPNISVLGGNPLADIIQGSTTTSAANGTFYGVVDEGTSITRNFIISNTGGCPLDVSSIASSLADFSISYILLPNLTPTSLPRTIASGSFITVGIKFVAPIGGTGTKSSIISISNTDNTTYTFMVSAEMFNYEIPGPGGITADFRLWLKSTRGIKYETGTTNKVSCWSDLGTNGKDASQSNASNQPTFVDNAASNINFNPVIKFENNGSTINQYLQHIENGYYSQDIFMVMEPDVDVTSSSGMTIFSGTVNGYGGSEGYVDDVNELSGIGMGNFSTNLTGERLWFNQGSKTTDPFYAMPASSSRTYSSAGIINFRNSTGTASDGMSVLYNSINDGASATKSITTFENLGYVSGSEFFGTPYKIGKSANATYGDLNGRVAEIFTFAERVGDTDRQKIESYLAIKYSITLGSSNEAQKNYVNSFGTKVWDITSNSGFNFHVAGIGRDSISDLNQKQSKTLNTSNEVTIGLGGLFSKNSENTNEFGHDGDFLVWGCNNASYTGSNTNTVSIGAGVSTTLTRIDRKWKIIESTEDVSGDLITVYVGIPENVFSSFTKSSNEEYVLIVADNPAFADGDIIDVIPLKIWANSLGTPILDKNGNQLYQTWYDFHETKYFTFGKAPKTSQNSAVSIGSGNYLVGESALNLNVNEFSISSWVKCSTSNTVTRTLIATMALTDSKWHQVTLTYNRGTVFLYIDGVLDKSIQNIEALTPNYHRFSVGAVYVDRHNVLNPLLGEIDEVYVWDFALSESQIRYLMNQEIERFDNSGTDYVGGKVLPPSSPSNEVSTILWSGLRAYYDFNNYYGTTTEGQTNSRLFLRLNYLSKTKSIQENQTAPLPYISQATGEWGNSSTWLNNTGHNTPNSISLNGSTYIDWNIVKTSHNITSGDKNITVLGLINDSNKITIADPIEDQDETNTGQGLTITNYLKIDGVIDLVGESQLVQTGNSEFDASSSGYIERDQQGEGSKYRYNDWSSPVYTANDGNNYTTIKSALNNGTISSNPEAIAYTSNVNGSLSPFTLSTYWMYKYANSPSNSYSSWNHIGEDGKIYAGEGFLMKGPGASGNQNYVFIGKPNNGTIELPVSAGNDYLIGNPYPSSIEADQFILDNADAITGSLYFWEHYGGDSHSLKDYQAGYATYNLSGGTQSAIAHSAVSQSGSSTKTPVRYIPVGQGFFVVADADGGTIQFNNNQRAFQIEDTANSIFFKNESNKKHKISQSKDERIKIKIGMDAPKIKHRQILLTIDNRATDKVDWGFDAEIYEVLNNDIFWMIEDRKFVIQGIDKLNFETEIPIGIYTEEGGLLNIKIDSIENVDAYTEIYLFDKLIGQSFKMSKTPITINIAAGDYLDRFKIIFKSIEPPKEKFISEEIDFNDNSLVFMNNQSLDLQVQVEDSIEINRIQVFNLLGQLTQDIKGIYRGSKLFIPLKKAQGVYFVRLTTNKGIINKKILMN